MGLKLMAPSRIRLNSLVAIEVPDGVDSERARKLYAESF
jgi:aspartate aminotransferase-like enzyme